MIKNKDIEYIKEMTNQIVDSMNNTLKEFHSEQGRIWSSSNRAKFKRLRVELTKELFKIEKELYK